MKKSALLLLQLEVPFESSRDPDGATLLAFRFARALAANGSSSDLIGSNSA